MPLCVTESSARMVRGQRSDVSLVTGAGAGPLESRIPESDLLPDLPDMVFGRSLRVNDGSIDNSGSDEEFGGSEAVNLSESDLSSSERGVTFRV